MYKTIMTNYCESYSTSWSHHSRSSKQENGSVMKHDQYKCVIKLIIIIIVDIIIMQSLIIILTIL